MKLPLLTFVTLLFCFAFTSCSKSPDEYSMSATGLSIKGDVKGAIEEISKGIALRTDDAIPKEADNITDLERELLFRADLYIKVKEYEKAYEDADYAFFCSGGNEACKTMIENCEYYLEKKDPAYFKKHERKSEHLIWR